VTHEEICGDDTLREVYRHHKAGSDAVVRWCFRCGAVVVDEDYDGRTNIGTYMPMLFPATSQMVTARLWLEKTKG
jgi:hypothetical protein